MLTLKIIGAVVALVLGLWLGLPGRYTQDQDDIERAMNQGGARRNTVKKRFTFINWYSNDRKGSDRRRVRRHFTTAVPRASASHSTKPLSEDRDQKDDREEGGLP